MARYEHLPIYKKAIDVAVHFEKVAAGFSRYHKFRTTYNLNSQESGRSVYLWCAREAWSRRRW